MLVGRRMIINRKKQLAIWTRKRVLQCVQISLKLYARTGDKYFYERAKEFGSISLELKKNIQKHD